jgi:Flp pilus assembly protein TadG
MRILLSALRSTSMVRRMLKDESGAALVEFAFVAPLLVMLMVATIIFTWALVNYGTLQFAAGTGAQVITTERLNASSTNWTPYTDTVNAVKASSSILNQTVLSQAGNIVVSVNNTACTTDAACKTALAAVSTASNIITPASVTVTYPCDPVTLSNPFSVLWLSFGNCSFSTTITGVIQ